MRVPVVAGSLVDLTAELERPASRAAMADAFRAAEAGDLAGILGITDEELVSSDFIGDPRSAVVDLPLLEAVGERLVRVVAWYDNEWGYANRLADLLELHRRERRVKSETPQRRMTMAKLLHARRSRPGRARGAARLRARRLQRAAVERRPR